MSLTNVYELAGRQEGTTGALAVGALLEELIRASASQPHLGDTVQLLRNSLAQACSASQQALSAAARASQHSSDHEVQCQHEGCVLWRDAAAVACCQAWQVGDYPTCTSAAWLQASQHTSAYEAQHEHAVCCGPAGLLSSLAPIGLVAVRLCSSCRMRFLVKSSLLGFSTGGLACILNRESAGASASLFGARMPLHCLSLS